MFLFIASTILFFAYLFATSDRLERGNVSRNVRYIPLCLSILLLGLSSFKVISPGEVGIQVTFGNMNMEPLTEGPHFVAPWSSVQTVSVKNRKYQKTFTGETSDTQTINIDLTVNWYPETSKICELVKRNGEQYDDVLFPAAFNETLKAEVAKHKVTDIVKSRPEIKVAVEDNIKTWLSKYGITIIEVGITEIDFSREYDAAIEAKQVAEQDAQRMVNVLTKTRTEAEMAAAEAKGKAEAKIAAANGEAEAVKLAAKAKAEALKIEADAQAEYNKKVAESLTQALINRMWIEKWQGNVPHFMAGGGTNSPVFMVPVETSK